MDWLELLVTGMLSWGAVAIVGLIMPRVVEGKIASPGAAVAVCVGVVVFTAAKLVFVMRAMRAKTPEQNAA